VREKADDKADSVLVNVYYLARERIAQPMAFRNIWLIAKNKNN
jgi:hypothetical protein